MNQASFADCILPLNLVLTFYLTCTLALSELEKTLGHYVLAENEKCMNVNLKLDT